MHGILIRDSMPDCPPLLQICAVCAHPLAVTAEAMWLHAKGGFCAGCASGKAGRCRNADGVFTQGDGNRKAVGTSAAAAPSASSDLLLGGRPAGLQRASQLCGRQCNPGCLVNPLSTTGWFRFLWTCSSGSPLHSALQSERTDEEERKHPDDKLRLMHHHSRLCLGSRTEALRTHIW